MAHSQDIEGWKERAGRYSPRGSTSSTLEVLQTEISSVHPYDNLANSCIDAIFAPGLVAAEFDCPRLCAKTRTRVVTNVDGITRGD